MTADKWAGLSLADLLALRESLNARIGVSSFSVQ